MYTPHDKQGLIVKLAQIRFLASNMIEMLENEPEEPNVERALACAHDRADDATAKMMRVRAYVREAYADVNIAAMPLAYEIP